MFVIANFNLDSYVQINDMVLRIREIPCAIENLAAKEERGQIIYTRYSLIRDYNEIPLPESLGLLLSFLMREGKASSEEILHLMYPTAENFDIEETDFEPNVRFYFQALSNLIETNPYTPKHLVTDGDFFWINNYEKDIRFNRYMEIGNYKIDRQVGKVYEENEYKKSLYPKTLAVLLFLEKYRGQICSSVDIVKHVFPSHNYSNVNNLRLNISYLRSSLNDTEGQNYIETIWGLGYRLLTQKEILSRYDN